MTSSQRSHYEILGVPADATAEQIKDAYRSLVKAVHPDRQQQGRGLFGLVQDAYDVLSNPASRADYDRSHASGSGATPPSDASRPSAAGYQNEDTSTPRPDPAGPGPDHQGGPNPYWMLYRVPLTRHLRAHRDQFRGWFGTGRGYQVAFWTPAAVFAALWLAAWPSYDPHLRSLVGAPPVAGQVPASAWLHASGGYLWLTAAVTVLYVLRKHRAPIWWPEKVVLLAAAAAGSAFSPLLPASSAAAIVTGAAVTLYTGWLVFLTSLNWPDSGAQWESFPDWFRAALADRSSRRGRRIRMTWFARPTLF